MVVLGVEPVFKHSERFQSLQHSNALLQDVPEYPHQ